MDPSGPVPGLIHTWSPELTLEAATEQVNGKEGDTLDIPPEDEVIRKVKEDGTRGRENTLSL